MEVRGQASLYDGIMFLVLSTISTSLLYVVVSNYGVNQEHVLNNAHTLTYIHSAMKAIYSIDARSLKNIKNEGLAAYEGMNCSIFASWPIAISVSDLLKKDLSDPDENKVILNDTFGDSVKAPGKTAMRCLMKEVMKPFSYSGYKYLIDLKIIKMGEPSKRVPVNRQITRAGEEKFFKITNSNEANEQGENYNCDDVADSKSKLQAVSSLFRTTYFTSTEENRVRNMVLRICIWP